jgi:hypothetical protein
MNDKNASDKQIDEIAYRIRNAPVPDYPGQQLLDSLAIALPERDSAARVSRPSAGRKLIAVSCSVVVLFLAVSMINYSNVVEVSGTLNPLTKAPVEPDDLKIGAVQIVSINITPEFNRMTDQLDLLDARLQILATQVAIQEVRSDAATLLAEFSPRESTVR